MDYQPFLLFTLQSRHYGITASAVQELFLLPALTPIAEAIAATVGILNLRGQIVPVIDLNQRLGHQPQPHTLHHVVLLLTVDQQSVGAIVDEVHNVDWIAVSEIASATNSQLLAHGEQSVTAGLAKHNSQLVTLLNPRALLQDSRLNFQAELQGSPTREDLHEDFLAQFTPAEQVVLQARATGLMAPTDSDSQSDRLACAIVRLQEEYFAVGLEAIQEFTDVTQVTPIPCCPSHIVGNMNLRGEILTLVDIRPFLNLTGGRDQRLQKAIITRVDDILAGIVVDEVLDVVYLPPAEIAATPTVIHVADTEYLRGMAAYQDQMMSLLDLSKLLTHGGLIVDQVA